MGLYFVFFIILFVSSIAEIKTKGNNWKGYFLVLYLLFSFLLIFRYGQGTDYFGYESTYDRIDETNYAIYKDIGFSTLIYCSKINGVSYLAFNMLFSTIIAALYYIFIIKNSKNRIFALLVLYCVFYFPIISSAIRQSLAIGIFGAFMLPQLRKGTVNNKYYLFCFISCLFHIASIITLFFPLIKKIDIYKHPIIVIVFFGLFSVLNLDILNSLFEIYDRGSGYLDEEKGSNFLALMARLMLLLPILLVKKGSLASQRLDFQACILYFVIYLSTWNIPFISGRLLLYLRLYYIPGWEGALQNKNRLNNNNLILLIHIALAIMYFKEINTAIIQGGYVNSNIVSYPFVSIFDINEINYYRTEF